MIVKKRRRIIKIMKKDISVIEVVKDEVDILRNVYNVIPDINEEYNLNQDMIPELAELYQLIVVKVEKAIDFDNTDEKSESKLLDYLQKYCEETITFQELIDKIDELMKRAKMI